MREPVRLETLQREVWQTYDRRSGKHRGVVEVVDDIELEVIAL